MKCAQEFRDKTITGALLAELKGIATRPLRFMEVCGTHTVAVFRHGLRSLLPPEIELISGPGCPVCVTPTSHINAFIQAANTKNVLIATFGDLLRVPGSNGSLLEARANGAAVELVYSPMDALTLAQNNPQKIIFFPGVGFETTAPTIAATVLEAQRLKLDNFCIFPGCKLMPPPLEALLAVPELKLDGLLCPGHVSAIIGADAYTPLAKQYHLPCAVAGFEPADILAGLLGLTRQVLTGKTRVDNCYPRVVTAAGNIRARKLLNKVFIPEDTCWRGLGMIPGSGLALRDEFQRFNALNRLELTFEEIPEPAGCKCGAILQGLMQPHKCPLYATTCTPVHPIGPCMVSSEGTCAAYYRFSRGSRHQ